MGLHRPNSIPPLSEYAQQTKLIRGWKVPKLTKFPSDISEFIVEHVARYQTDADDITNNENLKMKYFLNSLTKNAFIWSSTLHPHPVQTWSQLERLFYEQFYMGQSKIRLKELASVR